jgi:lipopolysaccharide export system permease protein
VNFEKIIDFLKDKISTFLEICKRLFSLFMVKVFNPLRTKIDYFQCKYLHKGQLKKFVIIRYIVKELTLYFLVCFLFFFMIFFVNQILLLAEQILKQRVPFADVARLMLYCLPGVISQSAPFATLVGFLMCLGRLMSDNEILIFRASGQSYKLVLIPVLVLGMVISIVSFFVNDYLLPVGNMKFSKLKREIAVANPTIEIESNSIKRLKNSTIIIGDVNDKEVSDMLKELQELQMQLQASQLAGQEPDRAITSRFQTLSTMIATKPLAAQYMQAQGAFMIMMNDVFGIIGEAMGVNA